MGAREVFRPRFSLLVCRIGEKRLCFACEFVACRLLIHPFADAEGYSQTAEPARH